VIFSNSKSFLEAICNITYIHSNYIILCQAILNVTKKGIIIMLFWIPSHSDILSNETVVAIAKEAASSVDPTFKIPYKDLYAEAKSSATRQFEKYLRIVICTKDTKFYENYYQSQSKPWFGKSLKRKEIVLINWLRFNHYNLNETILLVHMVRSNKILIYCHLRI